MFVFSDADDADDYDSKDDAQLMPPPSWLPGHSRSEHKPPHLAAGSLAGILVIQRCLKFNYFRFCLLKMLTVKCQFINMRFG